MKATKIIAAAALAIASTGAFAETGVKVSQIDSVTNVYGRAAVAAVAVKGNVQTAGAEVTNSGRQIVATQGTIVNVANASEGGRS